MACLYIKTLWSSYYDVTSVDFNSKKSAKIKFSTNKIYYNFSQEYPKNYKYVKYPNMR